MAQDCSGYTRCEHCPFHGILVGGRGPKDSPFVIVGESPGKEEVKAGKPFVGPSERVLQNALDQHARGSYPEPYIINAFKCFPGTAKDPSTMMQATQACHGKLDAELRAYPRKVILALGNAAVWSVTNNYGTKITKVRGNLFPTEYAEIGAVAAAHPAYYLRGSGSLRQFKADVDYAVSLVKGGPIRTFDTSKITYELVDTPEKLYNLRDEILTGKYPYVASDAETTGFSFRDSELLCLGISLNGYHSYILTPEVEHLSGEILGIPPEKARFVWHNGKFDVKFYHHRNMPARVDEDTMLQSYTLEEIGGIHDLESVAFDWLHSPNWKNELKKYIPKGGNYGDVPKPILYRYLAYDLYNTFFINQILRPKIERDPKDSLKYFKTLIPASKFLARVEENGIYVDKEHNGKLRDELFEQASGFEEKLNVAAREAMGREVNPNSPKQLAELFYDVLKFPTKRNSRSTDADTLESLPAHPAVDALRAHRKIFKAYSTYVEPLQERLSSDGRIHTTFKLHATRTGRLASSDPVNLQNIPRDPKQRGQYIPEPGRWFLEVDLNQAELRSLACLSNDPELCRIYETEGMSIHEVTRGQIFGNPDEWTEEQVVKFLKDFFLTERFNKSEDRIVEEQKMRAKTVNFGIVYGRTAPSIAEEFSSTVAEAQKWIDAWFQKFPKAREFIQACRAAPYRQQNLVTVFGYRKRHTIVTPELLTALANEASNFPHQNTAALITLHGAMNKYEELEYDYDTKIVNTVHDSILFETPADRKIVETVTEIIQTELEAVPKRWGITRIPFIADSKVGNRWGSLVKPAKWWAQLEAANDAHTRLTNALIAS